MPKLKEKSFKNRMLCFVALAYISMFKLPRKFLVNYFRGKGKAMIVDTNKLILSNNIVLDKFAEAITSAKKNGSTKGYLRICQTDVHDPNYKYSIGSFTIQYSIHDESIEAAIESGYHFKHNPNRLTRHLHSWLFSLATKGYAKSFNVKGSLMTLTFSELDAAKINSKPGRQPKNVFLL
jgi:hypothetical protein